MRCRPLPSWPRAPEPQHQTVPSPSIAHACDCPDATSLTFDSERSCTGVEMSDAERRAVAERLVGWARREQGVTLELRGADW